MRNPAFGQALSRFPVVGVLLLGLAGCGGGGSGGSSSGIGGSIGNLQLLDHAPTTDAVQVPVEASIELSFDAPIDPLALNADELTLVGSAEASLPGTFTTRQGGRIVVFTPAVPLDKASDYEFRVQPTLCDTSFRTLDVLRTFRFRTFDDIPPNVAGASIADNQSGVVRTGGITVQFDEDLDAASISASTITLKDKWGTLFPLELSLQGGALLVTPLPDLPGSRELVLAVRGGQGGVHDRAGNPLAETWRVRFTTELDITPPELTGSDPEHLTSGVSPRARLALRFSESMDPASFEPSGLTLVDAFLNPVPFALSASPDQRTLYLLPRTPMTVGHTYTVTLKDGATGLADVSGNNLAPGATRQFSVGDDVRPPAVATSHPRGQETRISPNAEIELWFDEAVKRSTLRRDTVTLTAGNASVLVTLAISGDGSNLLVTPHELLPPQTACTLRLAGGYDGVQDVAGNPLPTDWNLTFTTSAATEIPTFIVAPPDAATGVPTTSRITAIASAPLDAGTVTASTFVVKDTNGDGIAGSLSLTRGDRAVVFEPAGALPTGTTVVVRLKGGYGGIRLANGNWSASDIVSTLHVGFQADLLAPETSLTLNRIAKTRNGGLVVPPWGFTIDASGYDPGNTVVDPSTWEFVLQGPGSVPSPDELFALTTFDGIDAHARVDADNALPDGDYMLTARVQDLSGNPGPTREIAFTVAAASPDRRPFERTQLVWVQFDSDREGKGRGDGKPDFDEDLLDLGLIAAGDPIGRNAFVRRLVTDGVLTVANELFDRDPTGGRRSNSVNLRLVTRQPYSAPHMRIAVGGLDPNGSDSRTYGDPSTGILGRALYDYRNDVPNENNSGTSPGLGVFVGELFLYQTRLYLDLYPYYITTFGRTYRGLSPHMGGKPAGTHPLDAAVLAEDFHYGTAAANERARYDEIMRAADDLAIAAGVVLAHEIGHSLGLVAEGQPSRGLHGDGSLHNATTNIADVMGAVIGYESLVTTTFAFRPLNMAYLRERVLIK